MRNGTKRKARLLPVLLPRAAASRSAAAGRAPTSPIVALGKALDLFRTQGFASTSLDDLGEATGMNRPSLYGAFGDKRELYIKSYQRYREEARAAMVEIFREGDAAASAAGAHLRLRAAIYLSGEAGPRGCFTVVTAASKRCAIPTSAPW